MKKIVRISVILIISISVLVSLGSCTLWKAIFGPDAANILDWMPDLKEGTKLTYKWTATDEPGESLTEIITVNGVTKTDDKITFQMYTNGSPLYYPGNFWLIASKSKGKLVHSVDSTMSDDDVIVGKQPVEEGTRWVDPDGDTWSITQTAAKLDVGAGSFSDVVVIKHEYQDYPDQPEVIYWSVKQGPIRHEYFYRVVAGGTLYVLASDLSTVD
jgi:hypothetical protein